MDQQNEVRVGARYEASEASGGWLDVVGYRPRSAWPFDVRFGSGQGGQMTADELKRRRLLSRAAPKDEPPRVEVGDVWTCGGVDGSTVWHWRVDAFVRDGKFAKVTRLFTGERGMMPIADDGGCPWSGWTLVRRAEAEPPKLAPICAFCVLPVERCASWCGMSKAKAEPPKPAPPPDLRAAYHEAERMCPAWRDRREWTAAVMAMHEADLLADDLEDDPEDIIARVNLCWGAWLKRHIDRALEHHPRRSRAEAERTNKRWWAR